MRIAIKFFQSIFRGRRIIITSDKTTKFIKLGWFSQLIIISALIYSIIYSTIKFTEYKKNKDIEILLKEIEDLKNKNEKFKQHAIEITDEINAINIYLADIAGIKNVHLQKIDNPFIALEQTNLFLKMRSSSVNSILSAVGLKKENTEIFKNKKDFITKGPSGGPFEESLDETDDNKQIKNYEKPKNNKSLKEFVLNLTKDEKLLKSIPIAKPMNNFKISSHFGKRKDPINQHAASHGGIDLYSDQGSIIYASESGKVLNAGSCGTYGMCIEIKHGDDSHNDTSLLTKYAHLSKIFVTKGEIVKKNQAIGQQGSTGRSTGEHLHYEVRHNNKKLDPLKFINFGNKLKEEEQKNQKQLTLIKDLLK